jgi:hypothetical protein
LSNSSQQKQQKTSTHPLHRCLPTLPLLANRGSDRYGS